MSVQPDTVKRVLNVLNRGNDTKPVSLFQGTGHPELDKAIQAAGYAYDPEQDIFYSELNPWQRSVGYCRLYDEAAAPLGMIIDCEPIFFDYQGKKWMISFWKGQYDLVTGGEVGIYTGVVDLDIPDTFKGTFYTAVDDSNLIPMSYTLIKDGKTLFTREAKHWWLTGFKLGEYSEPSDLVMKISLTLLDTAMCDAFVSGLKKAGYDESQFTLKGTTVNLTFDVPHTPQPLTRTKETDDLIQRKNKDLCDLFQSLTGDFETVPEKISALEKDAPELYQKVLKLGKGSQVYDILVIFIMLGAIVLARLFGTKKIDFD